MLSGKDLLGQFKAAAWKGPEGVEAFLASAEAPAPQDLLKLFEVLEGDRVLYRTEEWVHAELDGALRGRAMAGSAGNARARIFCSKNEAELVSIDGYYRTAEEMDANLRSRPAQCWLENRVLAIAALD